MMRSFIRSLALLLGFLSSVVLLTAQDTCPDIVGEALGTLDTHCADIGRNQVCYGNSNIIALDFAGDTIETFASRGDMVEINTISKLELSGLDEEIGLWGVALMLVQADIPDTLPGQNVTIVLFGETSLETTENDASSFIFSSGIGNSTCNEAPDGMLIQTPEGVGEIHLSLNNIEIELGSTAYIEAEAEGEFRFALLEGNATLNTGDSEVTLTGSHFTSIELDDNLEPVGEFSEVLTIENYLELPELPIQVLPRDISELLVTSEHIQPKQGDWTFTLGEIEDGDCPAGISSMMTRQLFSNEEMFIDFGGEDWDFETFFRTETAQNTGGNVLDGTFSSPEANAYVYHTEAGDSPFSFGMTILSESHIQGFYLIDMQSFYSGCDVKIDFEVTLSE